VPRLLKMLRPLQLAWRLPLLVRWMLLLVQRVTPARPLVLRRLLLRMRPVHMVPAWRLLQVGWPLQLALRPLVLQRPLLPTRIQPTRLLLRARLLLRPWRLFPAWRMFPAWRPLLPARPLLLLARLLLRA
jgi:hypothetical protein